MTEYLMRGHGKGKKGRAHLWTGSDTVCRMWSTGGLRQSKYSVHSDLGERALCSMCESVEADRRRWAIEDARDDAAGWEATRHRIATAFAER